jgi:serine/threonine-protein kinase
MIGNGGLGVVFKAWDLQSSEWVALKFLSDRLRGDPNAELCLAAEATITSAFRHPNVCGSFGFASTNDGRPFIVMQYCEGTTLKRVLEAGPLAVGDAVAIAAQIADGVAYLHRRKVVHSDIKPANIMVMPDGVKLIDFGLSTAPVSKRRALPGSATPGTPAYMAPEQSRGLAPDTRSDMWALGVVLFEMLTGQTPFKGSYSEAIWYSVRHDPVPTLRVPGTHIPIPTALVRLVRQLLDKNPEKRYADACSLARELRRLKTRSSRFGPHAPGRRHDHDWHNDLPLPGDRAVGYRGDGCCV